MAASSRPDSGTSAAESPESLPEACSRAHHPHHIKVQNQGKLEMVNCHNGRIAPVAAGSQLAHDLRQLAVSARGIDDGGDGR